MIATPAPQGMWFEVANVKFNGTELEIQVRGDRNPHAPRWLKAPGGTAELKVISEALDKKRVVLAHLIGETTGEIKVESLTIQYADTAR